MITFFYKHKFLCHEFLPSHSIYEYDATIFTGPLTTNGAYTYENGETIHKMLKRWFFYQVDDYIIIIVNLYVE